MIINANNKDNILKGMVKRGFNQDPNEIKAKIVQTQFKSSKQETENFKKTSLKDTYNVLKNLK